MSDVNSDTGLLARAIADLDADNAKAILGPAPRLANELTTHEDETGETMLCFAIVQRSIEGDHTAVSDDQLTIVQSLVDAGAGLETVRYPNNDTGGAGDCGMFPLGTAAWLGKLRIVDLLIEAGADVDGEPTPTDTAIEVAADHRHAEVVERLIQADATYSAKTVAQAGLTTRLAELLDRDSGAANRSVHLGHLNGVYGPPLLALVEEYGFEDPHLPEVARLLIERGADVNVAGSDGKTALQRARGKRRLVEESGRDASFTDEVIQLLIDNGAAD